MSVDRLSVTVPAEVGAALRALAAARETTVSNLVTDAIQVQLRLAALDTALAEADLAFGPLSESEVAAAEAVLANAAKHAAKAKRRRRRGR